MENKEKIENKNLYPKTLVIVVAIIILVGGLTAVIMTYNKEKARQNNVENNNVNELKVEVIRPGEGAEAKAGDTVSVHYVGRVQNSNKNFDSSYDRGTPFVFTLGSGQVIEGWDQGIVGMKVGEKRKLTIPPELGYGEIGVPAAEIPPEAVLVFDVEMMKIN